MRIDRCFVPCLLAIAVLIAACTSPPPPSPPPSPSSPRPPPSPAPDAPKSAYRVVGTEPFWGVQVDGDRLLFTTVDDPAGKRLQAPPKPRPDGVRYAGSDGTTAFALDLQRGTCSDGMSDKAYTYTARFRFGGIDYAGCADEVR